MDRALESEELFELDGWKHIAPAATEGTLHLIGLLSDGGVHSRYDQLKLLFDGVNDHLTSITRPDAHAKLSHEARPACYGSGVVSRTSGLLSTLASRLSTQHLPRASGCSMCPFAANFAAHH